MYNRVRDDLGKGLEMLRRSMVFTPLANGTVIALIDKIPVKFMVKRIVFGSAIATDISGNMDVLALPDTTDLDTAAGSTNQLITQITAFADKKSHNATLSALASTLQSAQTNLVLTVAHNGAVPSGVTVVVEWDAADVSYGAYDAGGSSLNTY